MSDPLDYAARLKAKGLDSTGVTEEHARAMANRLGGHTVLIVDVVHDTLVSHADGRKTIQLAITQAEPVPEAQEEAVREFMRALYRARPDQAGQAVLTGTIDGEPTVGDAAAGLAAATEDLIGGGPDDAGWDGNTEGPLRDAAVDGPLRVVGDHE